MDEVLARHGDDLRGVPHHGAGFLRILVQDGGEPALGEIEFEAGLRRFAAVADGAAEDVDDEVHGFFGGVEVGVVRY